MIINYIYEAATRLNLISLRESKISARLFYNIRYSFGSKNLDTLNMANYFQTDFSKHVRYSIFMNTFRQMDNRTC